jgi:hypothetical protein
MMLCRDVVAMLRPFLRDELSLDQRMSILCHLAVCPACRRRTDQAQIALDMSRWACLMVSDPNPDDVPEPLIQAILVSSHSNPVPR